MLLDVLGLFVMVVVSAVAFGAGVWLTRYLANPTPARKSDESDDIRRARDALTKIHDVATRVAADVDEHSTRVREINDELGAGEGSEAQVVAAISKLIASNEQMQLQLNTAEQKLQQQAIEIKTHVKEARTDALTKIPNRRALDTMLARCVTEFNRDGRCATLVMIDIDHFKKVNDFHGHQAGDAVLSEAAQVIKRAVPDPAFVGRYGGEEFAIVLQGVSISDAVKKAEQARRQIQQTRFNWRGKELRVTVSTGVAELQEGDDSATLIHRADKALYQSKQTSRNCGHWHDGETIRRIGLDPVIATKKRVGGDALESDSAETSDDAIARAKAIDGLGSAEKQELPGSADNPPVVGATPTSAAKPAKGIPPLSDEAGVLSKLSDRDSFTGDVRRRLAEFGRGGAAVSVVIIRVENYQSIVDEHGDEAGETALKTCAQFIQAAMRDLDHVARWHTDCFALLLPGSKLAGAKSVADRLQQALDRCRQRAGGNRLGLAIRCGAAEAQDGDDTEDLLKRCAALLDATGDAAENRPVVPDLTSDQPGHAATAPPAASSV